VRESRQGSWPPPRPGNGCPLGCGVLGRPLSSGSSTASAPRAAEFLDGGLSMHPGHGHPAKITSLASAAGPASANDHDLLTDFAGSRVCLPLA
jgi:hypothetical protein